MNRFLCLLALLCVQCAHVQPNAFDLPNQGYAFLAVVAHPDDDAVFLADAIFELSHAHALAGALLVLTDGGKGGSRLGFELDDTLAALREVELTNAAGIYGVDAMFAGFPDYGIDAEPQDILDHAWGEEEPVKMLVAVIRASKPALVLTSDPKRCFGHAAHRAAGMLTEKAIALAADDDFEPQLGEAWHVQRHFVNRGRDDDGPFYVDTKRYHARRREVTDAYPTQWEPGLFADAPPRWRFRLAHGKAPRGAHGLLDGLKTTLPRRAPGAFPKVTRLYQSLGGATLVAEQKRRLALFEATRGPYVFKKQEPAHIARAVDVPIVDANPREFAQAQEVQLPAAEGLLGKVRLMWHPLGLFGFVAVEQKAAVKNLEPRASLWKGDCFELLINGDPSSALLARPARIDGDRQFIIAPSSHEGTPALAAVTAGGIAVPDSEVASRVHATGYDLEFFIPRAALRGWAPTPGTQLRFDAAVNGTDSRGARAKIAWHDTTRRAWCCPDTWGIAQLQN